ncbi:phospholipid-transporting ATPase-like protein [Emericellopsis cladophorae]|uniref:Phospholipid-transporting ATPase n=1 Tax=Emericellopsis cladophorae TaxID=2686198 RepID=A0A9P9Y7I7_9HYPO|nr:phospholipid-transporting ATPase-like protein [Emericellopsis cladophorae]KAI6785068.1 phospholipid-transporting ATPase-like protein [Emericellopsis cladophorae]
MSSSPRPRQPQTPDSPTHDSDSDLDLDIQELDPISTESTRGASQPQRHSGGGEQGISRIALRNLRMGGLRRNKRGRGYGDLGQNRDEWGEDTEGLLGEGSRSRYSDGEGHGDDDSPLLGEHAGRRSLTSDRGSRRGSRVRLPSFMSGSKKGDEEDGDDQEEADPSASRLVAVGSTQAARFPANIISNAKYTAFTFLPITLWNEFSFFFNMYFLLVALSQAIPALRIGYLSTYIAPLAFVLLITMGKEAFDDIGRRKRDTEANSEEYRVLHFDEPSFSGTIRPRRQLKSDSQRKKSRGQKAQRHDLTDIREEEEGGDMQPSSQVCEISKKSKDLKVGDVLKLSKGQRVPADVVILQCSTVVESGEAIPAKEYAEEEALLALDDSRSASAKGKQTEVESLKNEEQSGTVGETFIRTDQLDGETDWKLRLASAISQNLPLEEFVRLRVTGGKPDKKVNEFLGALELLPSWKDAMDYQSSLQGDDGKSAPLSIDNTAWANTIIASQATTLAVIIYTGPHTRSALSTSPSRSKTGLLEYEINSLTKILCALTLALSVILVALEGFENTEGNRWYVKIMRFLVLFSTIVPISLRVNLDMGKSAFSWFIQRDPGIPGAVVRTSTIPEDLGRIEYLLSDKTGTLTQNEMDMKKIHVGTVSYANEAMEEVTSYVRQGFYIQPTTDHSSQTALITPSSTFTAAANQGATRTRREIGSRVRDVVLALALCHNVTPTTDFEDGQEVTSYQASSPDEIAIVRWTESVGLRLASRDRTSMTLESTENGRPVVRVRILDVFPFTSDGKRMGIVVHFHTDTNIRNPDLSTGEIWFYQKGADTVMSNIVVANDWLDEETANMAREGLRTLVVGRKKLSLSQYREFSSEHQEASLAITGREAGMQRVVSHYLESDLELLGVTGVEDKLQRDVKTSLELLRNAGIKIWMLTGDKVETARCVAVSSKLVARGQYIYTVAKLKRKDNAQDHLDFLRSKADACLLIDGESLALFLTHFRQEFISIAVTLPTVVASRCSPTQKAEVALLIKEFTKKRVCCIGDGGNDVSMIQAADVGVGIVGKEGRQASLAADFSIEQFCHLVKLLVWHGRNSYKRSAKLAQFVIHRGLIIAVCQTMYSIALKFEPEGLYKDWLLVGYATVYTAFPVLSLVLDKDVDENLANLYPELYKELTSGRSLSYRTFFIWVLVSIYQGGMIQGLSQIFTEVDGPKMVAVSYTVLVLNELLMVAIEITTWHPVMIVSILGTFLFYLGSIPFLGRYFDLEFIITWGFLWRVLAIASISLVPPYLGKVISRTMKPPSYRKVQST